MAKHRPPNGKIRRAMERRQANIAEAVRLERDLGLNHRQIARQLGLHPATITSYFNEAKAQWRKAVPEAVEAARAQADAEVRKLVDECLEEYKRSKQPLRKVIQELEAEAGVKPEDWPVTKTRTELTERCGDTAYLDKAFRGIDMHCRLFGLYKPVPQEAPVGGGTQIAAVFALVQHVQEHGNAMPTIISEDGQVMVRGPDGVPMLPGPEGGGNGELNEGGGDGESD